MKFLRVGRQAGLTLIELLITLVVLAILLAIATPNFKTQIMNNRTVAMGETLANTLNFARTEALKRNARVTVCGSSDGATCNTGNWAQGMIVIVDKAATDIATPEVPDSGALLVVGAFDSGARITVSNAKTFVRYLSSGAIARIDNNPLIIQMHVDGCSGNTAQKLSISLSGSISIEKTACISGD